MAGTGGNDDLTGGDDLIAGQTDAGRAAAGDDDFFNRGVAANPRIRADPRHFEMGQRGAHPTPVRGINRQRCHTHGVGGVVIGDPRDAGRPKAVEGRRGSQPMSG